MKKIIILILMCLIIINVNAQIPRNYNGWYMDPNQTNDILVSSAITNFVGNNQMLLIDSYKQLNGQHYLKLTFIDDLFQPLINPPNNSIKYTDQNYEIISINDVKFDAVYNKYVACGMARRNTTSVHEGIVICFNLNGSVAWSKNSWDNGQSLGASNYNRIEIVNNSAAGDYYVACGDGYNGQGVTGVVGFYDVSGSNANSHLYFVTPLPGTQNTSTFSDLVYNNNNEIAVVGTYYTNALSPLGMITQQITLTAGPTISFASTNFHPVNTNYFEVTSVDFDGTNYYICGNYGGANSPSIFVTYMDYYFALNTLLYYYTFNTSVNSIHVRDMCYNPNQNPKSISIGNQLGITGFCETIYGGNPYYEGFLLELNINLAAPPIPLGFSEWSGSQYNPQTSPFFPLDEEYFDHIIYRPNRYMLPSGSTIGYSYIFYGGTDLLYPKSCIAEYYPTSIPIPQASICQERFSDYLKNSIGTNFPSLSNIANYDYFVSLNLHSDNLDIILSPVCDQYPYYDNSNIQNKNKANIENETKIFNYSDKAIVLNDDYKNSIINVFSIDGKLVYIKQKGVSTIKTDLLNPGIYMLIPIDTNLKTIKFNVIN